MQYGKGGAILEAIGALVVFALVLGGALNTFRQQSRIADPNGPVLERRCGLVPGPVTNLTARRDSTPSGLPMVRVSWSKSEDERGGDDDVSAYLVWRRPVGEDRWGEVLTRLPSGTDTYEFRDTADEHRRRFEYAVAAQDCSPRTSALRVAEGPAVD